MYEYGEYDGLVDLDAILHGSATPSTSLPGMSNGEGVAATSPTSNHSGSAVCDGAGEYPNLMMQQGHNNNNNNANCREQGSTSPPHSRPQAWKQSRDLVARGGAQGANKCVPRSNGSYPVTMKENDVIQSAASAQAAAAPTSRSDAYRRGEGAKGHRSSNTNHNNSGSAYRISTPPSIGADEGVRLPVILPSQQRRPTDGLIQSRVRVSPLTQETTKTAPTTPAMNPTVKTSSKTPHNARSVTSISPLANANSGGAKTVMSASNLAALQKNCNERAYTGPLSTGTSSGKAPPYLAPPLSPLHTRAHPPPPTVTAATTSSNTSPSMGGGAVTTSAGHATNGTSRRGELLDVGRPPSTHTTMIDITNPMARSGGWVKEEVRRIEHSSQELAAGFPQDRRRQSGAYPSSTSGSVESMRCSTEVDAGRGKANTSSTLTAPRTPVWSNDYEVGHTDFVGLSTSADFGAMPKVVAPPLSQRAKKTLSDSSNRRLAPCRPLPVVPSTPPAGKIASPAEAGTSPVRTGAQKRPLRQFDSERQSRTAAAAPSSLPVPLVNHMANSKNNNGGPNAAQASPADLNGNRTSRVGNTAAAGVAAASSKDAVCAPYTSGVASHRRIMMRAVDTHASASNELAGDRKAAAGGITSSSAAFTTTQDDGSNGVSSATMPQLPYTESCRAALEAWAAFPALDVTIRGQAPTATQLRRERDLAATRHLVARQLYQPVKGQAPQEFAGEPFEMNYDVHNVVVQLRHRNRPLMMAYPASLPQELDMRPRLRRQRTPRSFYGKRFPHVGDAWFRNALDGARLIESPDIESMEKREEEEFVRNGGDPAHRRNRYGQANNHHTNANHQQQPPPQQQQQQQQQQRLPPHAGANTPSMDQVNRNAVRMEQSAA
ncbi:hypothetical protein ABL78_5906 [Leptomonas seymouri]|uniref:Uncharacterized protein n=1 Tax=Leptomonas seymouri TaxID=5684 RepID=A0A0N1I2V0_LEPSE|nr:hypothetical protein ABL78_5906 [Leptomonas seymouri]|eukprot:KPI85044.1 hypothetical protein ABL78_5906 [Leptomonas seymouri]